MIERLVYSVNEAASISGISRSFLYLLWSRGEGPPKVKVGGRTLVPVAGLNDWLAANEVRQNA